MKLMSFDEAQRYLDSVADDLPDEVFKDLNGGIVLLPDMVLSEDRLADDLYILGRYHFEPYGLGRFISIYYGSFTKICAGSGVEKQQKTLSNVLRHELTHHIESMAGVRDLELRDEMELAQYRKRHKEK